MLRDSIADLPRQVEPAAVIFEHVDDAEALVVMIEAAWHQLIDHAFAGMAERCVSQIVPERNRFGQFLVETQDLGDRPGDLRDLERVCQARAIVVARWREEDLGLVLQPPKRF